MTTADIIRVLLLLDLIGMVFLAGNYLSRRVLTWSEYLLFGLFAVLVPVFGPFLVIALRPGLPRPAKGE